MMIGTYKYITHCFTPVRKRTFGMAGAQLRMYSAKRSIFEEGPRPPLLSREEQKEFEDSVKKAKIQMTIEEYNEKVGVKPSETSKSDSNLDATGPMTTKTIPEFEGNVNPKTGEVGGPKQDPTRHGDWSFNGRVTDF